jgi:plastocyanin
LSPVVRIYHPEKNVFFRKGSLYGIQLFSPDRKAAQKVIQGPNQNQGGRKHVNRYWSRLAILSAAILIGNAPVWAHEECDENDGSVANAVGGGVIGQPGRNITIKLFQYQPGRIQVKPGTMVTWINDDEIFHTVTLDAKEKNFDAALDGKGKSFSFTFVQPGIYAYYCDRHEHMRGEIEVR